MLKRIRVFLVFLFFSLFSTQILYADSEDVFKAFSHEDAVILNEEVKWIITGDKEFTGYNYISKKLKIKLLTEKGVKEFSTFNIPESFDPIYDYNNRLSNNIHDKNVLAFIYMKKENLQVIVIKEDGKKVSPKIIERKKTDEIILDRRYEISNYLNIGIPDLQVGDILEIEYKVEIPNRNNWGRFNCYRIFFHGKYPKQHYSFRLIYPEALDFYLSYVNGADPDSTIVRNKRKEFFWEMDTLAGCLNEIAARPHEELPFLVCKLNPNDERFSYIAPSGNKCFAPYWVYHSNTLKYGPEILSPWHMKNYKHRFDNENIKVKEFLSGIFDNMSDTLPYSRLAELQRIIAEDFSYKDDVLFYKDIKPDNEKIGSYCEMKVIREISRYSLYQKALLNMKTLYFKVFLLDARIGTMNTTYIPSMFNNTMAITPLYNDENIAWILPKKSRFGYYLDEMPFYWENTRGILLTVDDSWLSQDSLKLKFVETPFGKFGENNRKSSIMVDVDLDDLKVDMKAKVSLMGQFSTNIRGNYLFEHVDSTINPEYYHKIWEIDPRVVLEKKEVTKMVDIYPFNAEILASYSSSNLVRKVDDSTYELSVRDWFSHVIWKDLDCTNRSLDFYTDFLGQDSFKYILKFENNVELISSTKDISIENEFGTFIFKAVQIQPTIISIDSYFAITGTKIQAENINAVCEIYDKIMEVNNASIVIMVK